ncbi:MAG: hypothetical protein JJ958_06710 [Balneola sp.]|nr:hypothetical protein [Balneola sp.]
MLEKEFQYYLDNQEDLVKKYQGKYLVIIGEEIEAVYDTEEEAYFKSTEKYDEGTFLIQLCESGDEAYTQSFHSNVVFN